MSRCWKGTYFVPLDGVLEGELDEPLPVEGDVAEGDLLVSEDGDDDGDDGDVDGDADGARSLERSPVRPLGDSVQAVARVRTRASRPKPLRNFFIADTSRIVVDPGGRAAIEMPRSCRNTLPPDRGCTLGHPSRVTIAIGGQDRMKLEGSYDIPVPRQQVWEAFLDPEKLRQAIPGCEKLEEIGPDEYKATMKIGIAAVKGTFQGTVRLRDKQPPESYRLNVDGSGGPGFVRGDTVITLSDAAGGTHVAYNADVQIGGLIAGVGQRMLGGVSKMMADQFFTKMGHLLTGAK